MIVPILQDAVANPMVSLSVLAALAGVLILRAAARHRAKSKQKL